MCQNQCEYCGRDLETMNDRKKYCSGSCRTMAWRVRFKERGGRPPEMCRKKSCRLCGKEYRNPKVGQVYCRQGCREIARTNFGWLLMTHSMPDRQRIIEHYESLSKRERVAYLKRVPRGKYHAAIPGDMVTCPECRRSFQLLETKQIYCHDNCGKRARRRKHRRASVLRQRMA